MTPEDVLKRQQLHLNRCNRSGIIKNGGVIGGLDQSGALEDRRRFYKERYVSA